MSFYSDLHAGLIPGTEEDALPGDGGGVQPWSRGPWFPFVISVVDEMAQSRKLKRGRVEVRGPGGIFSDFGFHVISFEQAWDKAERFAREAAAAYRAGGRARRMLTVEQAAREVC